jgi:hypothetical protein
LALTNHYADGRKYFDDDPKVTLSKLGLSQADFTVNTPWDRYPVVARLLAVWELVEKYVTACVNATYSSDMAVAADGALQTWSRRHPQPTKGTSGACRGATPGRRSQTC